MAWKVKRLKAAVVVVLAICGFAFLTTSLLHQSRTEPLADPSGAIAVKAPLASLSAHGISTANDAKTLKTLRAEQFTVINSSPTVSAPSAKPKIRLQLLSTGKPTKASTRGNLADVSVIVDESVTDWLKDRWQAARNMQGEPIPGEHWVSVDLQRPYVVRKVVIDWEQAYSASWTLMGRESEAGEWITLAEAGDSITTTSNKMHLVQEVQFEGKEHIDDSNQSLLLRPGQHTAPRAAGVRHVKLVIHRPSTRWGSSIWRLQVWGY